LKKKKGKNPKWAKKAQVPMGDHRRRPRWERVNARIKRKHAKGDNLKKSFPLDRTLLVQNDRVGGFLHRKGGGIEKEERSFDEGHFSNGPEWPGKR